MTWRNRSRVIAKDIVVAARRAALSPLRLAMPARYCDADPYKIISIPTDQLTAMQTRWHGRLDLPWLERGAFGRWSSYRRRWHAGRVLDGDWDLACEPLADYHLTQIFHERFTEGRDWTEIHYIRRALKKVKRGERAWGGRCRTKAEVFDRCNYIDALHDRLNRKGYRADAAGDFTHFLVNIGRNGEIIRNNDGKHRIIMSRMIGIPYLKARVLIRHSSWQAVRGRIAAGDRSLAARHRDHPDLEDLLQQESHDT